MHINPILPYISDTAVLPPESAIFSQILNFGTLLLAVFYYIRYKNIKNQCKHKSYQNINLIQSLNRSSLYCGVLMMMGLSVLANFRNGESDFVQLMHYIGAAVGFVPATIDMALHAKIAFETKSPKLGKIRAVMCFIVATNFTVYTVFSFVSISIFGIENYRDVEKRLNWNCHQTGYYYHILSAFSEWVSIIIFSPYFATFIPEFKKININNEIIISDECNNKNIKQIKRFENIVLVKRNDSNVNNNNNSIIQNQISL